MSYGQAPLICDGPAYGQRCPDKATYPAPPPPVLNPPPNSARWGATRNGWRYDGVVDQCPPCAAACPATHTRAWPDTSTFTDRADGAPPVLHLTAYTDNEGELWWRKDDLYDGQVMLSAADPTSSLWTTDRGLPYDAVDGDVGPLTAWLVTLEQVPA